jgi:ribonuclease HII
MKALHQQFPQYNWKQNKGYPTKAHKKAIALHGVTPYHRLTFNMNEQLKLDF